MGPKQVKEPLAQLAGIGYCSLLLSRQQKLSYMKSPETAELRFVCDSDCLPPPALSDTRWVPGVVMTIIKSTTNVSLEQTNGEITYLLIYVLIELEEGLFSERNPTSHEFGFEIYIYFLHNSLHQNFQLERDCSFID